jgi:hypothetical protein
VEWVWIVAFACWLAFSLCWPWYRTERKKRYDDLMDLGGALLHTWWMCGAMIMHHSERYCMTQIEASIVHYLGVAYLL